MDFIISFHNTYTWYCVPSTIISSILKKLSNMTKVTLLKTNLLSQDLNLSWLEAEPEFLTYKQQMSIAFTIPQQSHEINYYYYPCLTGMELRLKARGHRSDRARIQFKSQSKPCTNGSVCVCVSLSLFLI